MDHTMQLTEEQQAILDGAQGETMARVMETLVRYGEIFGATKMVPVTSQYNHLVTSFGLKALTPVYDLMNQLIETGATSKQRFSADPRPLDPNVPSNFIQNIVFKKFTCDKGAVWKVVSDISRVSYGMYLMHIFILTAVFRLTSGYFPSTPACIFGVAIITYVITYLAAKALSYLPGGKYIVG